MRRIGVPPSPWSGVPDKRQIDTMTILDAEGMAIGTFDKVLALHLIELNNSAHKPKVAQRTFSTDARLVDKMRAVSPSIHRKRF